MWHRSSFKHDLGSPRKRLLVSISKTLHVKVYQPQRLNRTSCFSARVYSPAGQNYYCRCAGRDSSSQTLRNCRFSVERREQDRYARVGPTQSPPAGRHWTTDATRDEGRTRNDEEKNTWFMSQGNAPQFTLAQAAGTAPAPEVPNPLAVQRPTG